MMYDIDCLPGCISKEDKKDIIVHNIMEYFKDHPDEWSNVAYELDQVADICNGANILYNPMSDLLELTLNDDYDILSSIYYGKDDEGDDKFNPFRDFFYFDDSNILHSTDSIYYQACLTEDNILLMTKLPYLFKGYENSVAFKGYKELINN